MPSSHFARIASSSERGMRASCRAWSSVSRSECAMRCRTSAGFATPQMRRPNSSSASGVG